MRAGAALAIAVLLLGPALAGSGYRSDFDFAGRGDDWYGRFLPDPRRDFPAGALDRASDGDDFGRGYDPALASPGFGPPLELTDGPGGPYAFFHGELVAAGGDDCDGNGVLDTDQLAAAAAGCRFPIRLDFNGTTGDDATFLGPPDDVYYGVGGQIVTWNTACGSVVDGPGADFTVYEVDSGGPEFSSIDVLVSADGVAYVSVKASETIPVRIPGDEAHSNSAFARSYDLAGSGLDAVRYVRIDGNGTGASGTGSGFDLDAIGFVNIATDDCDGSGTIDACETIEDCNGNGIPESCEMALGSVADCDQSGTPDTCDTLGGVDDCDADGVPDACEPDCNGNTTPDDCDIAGGTSDDCNANAVPDECDLAATSVVVQPAAVAPTSQLVFEESFEVPDTTNFITYAEGESIVTTSTTWLVTTTGVDLYEAAARPEAAAFDGAQAIDLTGSPGAGVIETTLATGAGEAYRLDFHYARNNLLGAATGEAQVDVIGGATLLHAVVRHDPALHPFNEYLRFRGLFVADGAQVTLRFTSLNPGNTGITLDGISVAALGLGGTGLGVGSGYTGSFSAPAPFPAAGDVSVLMLASSDLGASNEYLDLEVNAVPLARFFETTGLQCVESAEVATIAADAFNTAVGGGSATFDITAPGAVNPYECADSYGTLTLAYEPVVDCNGNGTLDQCDIANATSTDVDLDGIADDCETDCNGNGLPDGYEVAEGLAPDCNANGIPDECDVSQGTSDDCDLDDVPDECELDCNGNGVNDECDLSQGTSMDCDGNAIPDECDLAVGAGGCPFPRTLLDNGTTAPDGTFLGPPDGQFFGLGGQIVTFELDCGLLVDGAGPDLNVYEVSSGSPEFSSLGDVLVSTDGIAFFSVVATEGPVVRIPGDEAHTSDSFARSYDIAATGLDAVRYVRLDGVGTGASGTSAGFDLDAIGVVNRADVDCDGSGVPDACETFTDCNVNGLPDSCELDLGLTGDCNTNGTLDSCDIAGGDPDVDADGVPDSCEPDCNTNDIPDHYDIEQGTSSDCNDNTVPDSCDLAAATSEDCNLDMIPDECAVCPTVEVTIIIDVSSSMTDEGGALCASVDQVIADLQADFVDVDVEVLGILGTGGSTFPCVTETVDALYGIAVPGNPPADQDELGESCGANLNEDWGPATAIVAGLRPWTADSVRLIVPISDEGPRCGNPVSDPGADRDAINNAIGQARLNDVIVSPISGTGSSQALVDIMGVIAAATSGQVFSTSDPDADLAAGVRDIIEAACFSRTDCNLNGTPDECDLDAGTSQDCDMSGRPDECEDDCNGNGLADSCDIADMTSDDDNTNAIPDECELLVLTADALDWQWTEVPGGIGYDLVRGTLGVLRSTSGDFSSATDACVVNDTAGTSWPLGPDPSPGEGLWYLVRGETGAVKLSYDTFGSGLAASRDAGIAASGVACP